MQKNTETDWFLHYIAPSFYVKNKLHGAIIVGGMGSGKTTYMISLLGLAQETLLNNGVDDDQIGMIHTMEYSTKQAINILKRESSIDLKKTKYLYIFIDDAPAAQGLHARQSQAKENVEESQFYIMIRHRLEDMGFKGFIFAPYATQVYNILDITVRRTAKLKIFKDYPEEENDQRIIGRMLHREYMASLREITKKIFAPKNQEELHEGLSSGVMKFLGYRRVVKLTPRRPKNLEVYINDNNIIEEKNAECGNADKYYALAWELLKKIMKNASIQSRGADYAIIFPDETRVWVRKTKIQPIIDIIRKNKR